MRRSVLTIGVSFLAAFSNSCWFHKTPAAFIPPPPKPQPSIPTELIRLSGPPPVVGNPNLPPELPENAVALEVVPPPDRTSPRHSSPAPARTTPSPTPEPPAPPRLAPVLPADTRRAYTRELDESLERVRRALEFLSTRNLNAEQANVKEQISTFKKQAEQYREQDLVLAKNLAERADKLAQDLVARVSQ